MRVARSVWILLAKSSSRAIWCPRLSMSTSRRVTRSARLSGIRRGGVFIGVVAQDVELLSPRIGPDREAARAAMEWGDQLPGLQFGRGQLLNLGCIVEVAGLVGWILVKFGALDVGV